jgi:hypothetical protein
MRRVLAVLCTVALAAGMVAAQIALPASAGGLCANPGSRQSGTISAIVNTYFAGTGTASAGTTTLTIGASIGAATPIAAQDLLLVIQMQDATISSSNSSSYGDGATGAGSLDDQTSGYYEYVVAMSAVTTAGGTLTIAGTGANAGLINTYHSGAPTASQGQQTFQVIRVPQFSSATVNITGTGTAAAPWNGTAGGVFALDVQAALTITGTINVDGDGFRGGGVQKLGGSGVTEPAAPQPKNADFVVPQTANYHGVKGEGTVGTPYAVYNGTVVTTGTDVLPGGSFARGAPGNAGGGGSDADPAKNDQNTGGGGGAGAGTGGRGGNNWSPSSTGSAADNAGTESATEGLWQTGGLGGKPVASLGVTRWTLGGGGGAGSNNDGTSAPNGSSGGVGGGVVLIRTGTATGGTISASGTTGTAPVNDGGGGGGGGGTIFVTATGNITATANAHGGVGTTANATNGSNTQDHGPGGGGGGGMVVTTSGSLTSSVTAGANGTTTTNANPFGATSGTTGIVVQTQTTAIPGVDSGGECIATSGATWTIGPNGYPTATGSYDGAVTASNQNDFTAVNIEPKSTSVGLNSDGSAQVVNTQLVASSAPCIAHSATVTAGNYTILVTAPLGWQAGVYSDSACTTLFGGATVGQQTTGNQAGIAAGTYVLYVQYTTASVISITPFARNDATISLYKTGATTPNNVTHDELYYGFVRIFKSFVVTTSTCHTGIGACPGSTLTYTIAYSNMVVNASSESTLTAPVPYPTASGLIVSDDGTAINNWAANSNGLVAAPTDTTAATTYTYKKAGVTTVTPATATQFSGTIGGAGFTLVPAGITGASKGTSGTITFSVVVK